MRTDAPDLSGGATGPTGSALALFARWRNLGLPLGILGLLGLVGAFATDATKHAVITSYFFGYFFWMGLTLGSCTLLYLHHSCRGAWGLPILRMLEAGTKNMVLMAILFLPIIYWMATGQVYAWTNPAALAKSYPMMHRHIWLNPTWFVIRAVFYFAFWIITTTILNRNTAEQDRTLDERLGQWRMSFGAPIGVIHIVVMTFAYTDWIMSLSPVWYSTMYGGIFMTSSLLSMLAFSTFLVCVLYRTRPYDTAMTPAVIKDLGNLILGFTMFWAYTNLAQFLIQWSGNLPEEIVFYANRFSGGLVFVGAIIVIGQFFAPFLMLLSGRTKRTVGVLQKVALLVVLMRVLDIWYQVTPFLRAGSGSQYLLNYLFDIAALLFIGGLWLFFFFRDLIAAPMLLPAHDKRLQYAKEHSHA